MSDISTQTAESLRHSVMIAVVAAMQGRVSRDQQTGRTEAELAEMQAVVVADHAAAAARAAEYAAPFDAAPVTDSDEDRTAAATAETAASHNRAKSGAVIAMEVVAERLIPPGWAYEIWPVHGDGAWLEMGAYILPAGE